MRIGIDLGTTNTVVSYIDENGMWKPIEFKRNGSKENPYFLPSCIAFNEGGRMVGQSAIDYGRQHPDRLLRNTKCSMGEYGKKFSIGSNMITPADVAQYILAEVKTELSSQFPGESFNAYVTVPARFGEPARRATKTALKNAGFELNECCLTDEPISASIAYSSHLDKDKVVFVADVGGGTFDLALIKTAIVGSATSPDNIETLSWGGELNLGGNDFDECIIKDIARQVALETGKDLYVKGGTLLGSAEETRAADIIRSLPYQIKKQLYTEGATEAHIHEEGLMGDYNLDYTLTRDKYCSLMTDLVDTMSNHIDSTFVTSSYKMGDVDHVLVIGGMAKEICLIQLLESKFGKDRILIPQDAMMLVSRGAAICNSNLSLHVENRAYSSIGLVTEMGKNVALIIKEGDMVKYGTVFNEEVEASEADATSVFIKLAEYRGAFDPDRYNIIFDEEVILKSGGKESGKDKMRKFANAVFGRKTLPRIKIRIDFTEDKILVLYVEQKDGSVSVLNHRL